MCGLAFRVAIDDKFMEAFFFFFVIIIVFIITATVPVIAVGFPIAKKKKKLVPSRVQFNYTNFSSHSLGPTGTFPDMVKGLQ